MIYWLLIGSNSTSSVILEGSDRNKGETCVSIDHIPGCFIGRGRVSVSCWKTGTEKALVALIITREIKPNILVI
jgi:hypothetical protein